MSKITVTVVCSKNKRFNMRRVRKARTDIYTWKKGKETKETNEDWVIKRVNQSINQSIAKYYSSEMRHCWHHPGDVLKAERTDTSDRCRTQQRWLCNGQNGRSQALSPSDEKKTEMDLFFLYFAWWRKHSRLRNTECSDNKNARLWDKVTYCVGVCVCVWGGAG